MSETHDQIMSTIQAYSEENSKFVEKGVKASATRARKALAELGKLIKSRRKEIQEVKNAAKTAA
jgi:capsular polysaccharide biosynthesis protein